MNINNAILNELRKKLSEREWWLADLAFGRIRPALATNKYYVVELLDITVTKRKYSGFKSITLYVLAEYPDTDTKDVLNISYITNRGKWEVTVK
jgi:hypothetical protein